MDGFATIQFHVSISLTYLYECSLLASYLKGIPCALFTDRFTMILVDVTDHIYGMDKRL